MRDSVSSGSYSSVCNVLRQWKSRSSLLIASEASFLVSSMALIFYIIIIMWLKVQSFITSCISYNPPTRVAECIYIGAVTRMNYLPFAAKAWLAT